MKSPQSDSRGGGGGSGGHFANAPHAPSRYGPAVGTWRSDLLCQKWSEHKRSDPRNAATQDVGRV
eukprot:4112800-Prymnesium_polylepis.1